MKQNVLFFTSFMLLTGLCFGQNWTQQASGFATASRGIHHMFAVDTNVVWASAYDGANTSNQIQEFTRTTNGGTTWTSGTISGVSGFGISMICAVDGLTAWVPAWGPSGGGKILKTSDGGATWVHQSTAGFTAPAGFPNVIYFWNANEGWCQGDPNGGYFEMYTTTDGGTTWTRVPQANIPAPIAGDEWGVTGYYAVYGNTVWFSTNKGRVYKSTNKGLNWTVAQTPITASQIRIAFANQNLGLIQENVSPYTAYRTIDGGNTWQMLSYSGLMFNNDLCYVPGTASTFVSTGADISNMMSGVSYSTDGGNTWTLFPYTDTTQFLNASFANPRHGWAGAFSQTATTGGMWKYSGNLFATSPCAGVQAAFSASDYTVDLAVSGSVTFTDQSTGNPTSWLWRFGDGSTATTQNPVHVFSALGVHRVDLIITAGSCIDSTYTEITVVNSSGIADDKQKEFVVFPTITNDYVYINNAIGNCLVEIYDISGRRMLAVNESGEILRVDISNLPQGLYLAYIRDDSGGYSTVKLVVTK